MPILPNAARAVIDERKIRDYLLDPSHPLGRLKARVFESALGYRQADFHDLIDQIRQGILHGESEATDPVPHGDRFRVDVPIAGPGGRVVVRTLWIIRKNEDVPRLTSAYPIK